MRASSQPAAASARHERRKVRGRHDDDAGLAELEAGRQILGNGARELGDVGVDLHRVAMFRAAQKLGPAGVSHLRSIRGVP